MTATASRAAKVVPAQKAVPSAALRPGNGRSGTLAALQRSAGNAAVGEYIQRFTESPGPVRPVGTPPLADPRFLAVKHKLDSSGKTLKSHPAPKAEVAKAQQAAVPPAGDKEAQAKEAQSQKMDAAKPGTFDKAGFIAAVKAAIAAQAPKNLDEAKEYGSSGKAENVKGQVAGQVAAGKAGSAKDISSATSAPPDQSKAVEKPVTPLAPEAVPQAAPVSGAAGMPQKAPAEQTDLSGGKRDTDNAMDEAGVTENQLAESNEPEFTSAVAAKKEGEAHSAKAPSEFRAQEAGQLAAAGQSAQAAGGAGLAAMLLAKKSALGKTAAGKNAAKSKDELARANVTAEIKSIFDTTKTDVEKILKSLDEDVAKKFDLGEKQVREAFKADLDARMARYKEERYAGASGKLAWARDLFADLPASANKVYTDAKAGYETGMATLIGEVADVIGQRLTAAKDRIAQGREQIKKYVDSRPKELQKVAQEAGEQFSGQFDELENDVNAKQDALVDDLAAKYQESASAVNEQITAMQDENKGLWSKAKDAVGGAIATIQKLKDMLLGVLSRAAAAIGDIIAKPVQFLGNFINAVKAGIQGFAARIGEHLKNGLQSWLLGALAEGGITLPAKFDLRGMIGLVLSILGLTWDSIRAQIIKGGVPEKVMSGVEKALDFIQILMKEGVGGLWKWVVEKLGDIKAMVMAKIKDFVITKIVTAGITWLISMLNPAAAFIKACKMIYDVVMFFVEKADQIKEFVDSVLDSVESIAKGGVGAVAGYIEKTLAKMVPVMIGFLASLLGLGGISDFVRKTLETVQKPIRKVVGGLVAKAVKYGKALWKKAKNSKLGKKVKSGVDKAKATAKKAKEYGKKKLEQGKAWAKAKAQQAKGAFKRAGQMGSDVWKKLRDKLRGVVLKESFSANGDDHQIFSKKGTPQQLYVASEPRLLSAFPDTAVAALNAEYHQKMTQYMDLLSQMTGSKSDDGLLKAARKLHREADKLLKRLVELTRKSLGSSGPGAHAPSIGMPAPHGSQTSRLRPKDKAKEVAAWRMESEHLIPREVISAFFSILPLQKVEIQKAEYDAMVTVLMYENASKIKTHTAITGDLASIRAMKQKILAKIKAGPAQSSVSETMVEASVLVHSQLRDRAKSALARAKDAAVAEQKTVGDARGKNAEARPTADEMDKAFAAQWEQIDDFWQDRLIRLENLRKS